MMMSKLGFDNSKSRVAVVERLLTCGPRERRPILLESIHGKQEVDAILFAASALEKFTRHQLGLTVPSQAAPTSISDAVMSNLNEKFNDHWPVPTNRSASISADHITSVLTDAVFLGKMFISFVGTEPIPVPSKIDDVVSGRKDTRSLCAFKLLVAYEFVWTVPKVSNPSLTQTPRKKRAI